MHKTGIVILNYHDTANTLDCLRSLIPELDSNTFVYLVNIEDESQLTKFENLHPNITLIHSPNNLGFSGGNNLGMTKAIESGCTHLILLNNDTLVTPGFIQPLIDAVNQEKVAFVSPKIFFAAKCEYHSYPKEFLGKILWYAGGVIDWTNMLNFHKGVDEVDRGQFDNIVETDFATGCCMATTTKVIKQIGLLDPDYFLYFEDTDWCQRAKKQNFQIIYQPKSVIYHKISGSTGGSGSKLQQYYQTRNRLLFALRYAPTKTKLSLFKSTILNYTKSNQTVQKAIRDLLLHQYGKRSI